MLEAVIFDMDGLLVNSEPLWKEAEQKVFASVGVILDEELCKQTTGLDTQDAVAHWYLKQPWQGKTRKQVEIEIEEEVLKMIQEKGELQPGVEYILDFFHDRRFKIGLASSAPHKIITSVIDKFGIRERFQKVHSSEMEEYGKPHPGVYIRVADFLGVPVVKCLAFEDSLMGLIAAKAARMKVVSVPEPSEWSSTKYDVADLKLKSLLDFGPDQLLSLMNGHVKR